MIALKEHFCEVIKLTMYKHISRLQHKQEANSPYIDSLKNLNRARLIQWRKEPAIIKIKRPTKLSTARHLGYKPKQGIVLLRVKVSRGARRKHRPTKGRRSVRMGVTRITANFSRQTMAENRASRKYENLEVLNSYYVGQDGLHLYYEVIMIDPFHPRIHSDPHLNWLSPATNDKSRHPAMHKGRSLRGLTSSARKARGLRSSGKGSERFRGYVPRR